MPVGELTAVDEPPAGYDIIGGGKTALDAICWLLDRGTSPDSIRWFRPRDSWVLNRAFFQPGAGALPTFEGVVLTVEAVAEGGSVEEIYERLEAEGLMLRTDTTVQPGLMRGATLSLGELEQLRRVSNIVRMGHVDRIDIDEIVLDQGSIPTGTDRLHVHCAVAGLSDKPPKPIFADGTISLQGVTRISASLSGSLLGYLESTRRTMEEKNTLCPPNPWPHTPFGYLRAILAGMRTEVGWLEAPDVQAFVDASRVNLIRSLPDQDPARVSELQNRFLGALFPALAKLDQLAKGPVLPNRPRCRQPHDRSLSTRLPVPRRDTPSHHGTHSPVGLSHRAECNEQQGRHRSHHRTRGPQRRSPSPSWLPSAPRSRADRR